MLCIRKLRDCAFAFWVKHAYALFVHGSNSNVFESFHMPPHHCEKPSLFRVVMRSEYKCHKLSNILISKYKYIYYTYTLVSSELHTDGSDTHFIHLIWDYEMKFHVRSYFPILGFERHSIPMCKPTSQNVNAV